MKRERERIEEARSYKRAMEMDDEQSLVDFIVFVFLFIDLPCVYFNAFYWIKQSKELSCCSLPEHNRYKLSYYFILLQQHRQQQNKKNDKATKGPHNWTACRVYPQKRIDLCVFFVLQYYYIQ